MPRVPSFIEGKEKIPDGLDTTYKRLAVIVNGRLSFGRGVDRDNIDGNWVNIPDTGVGDTDVTVAHNLGRIPVGYILMRTDVQVMIYDGSIPSTETEITLRFSTSHANVSIFII